MAAANKIDVKLYERIVAKMARLEEEYAKEKQARIAAENRALQAEEYPEKAKILKDINQLRKIEQDKGREIYYENQKATAMEVCDSILNVAIVFLMVIAVCQSGKTGCMMAIIELLLLSNSKVNPDNIFVITGLSDKEWVAQTRRRIPLADSNVIHRGNFKRSRHLFENLKDAVIIVDECHIACNEAMSVDNILKQSGLKDLKYLKENNIKIVEFSATPNSTLDDIENWETCSKVHIMEPGDGYKGHKALIEDNRLHQAQDLFIEHDPEGGLSKEEENERNEVIKPAIDAIEELKYVIQSTYKVPRFHIIRTPTSNKADTVIGRFKTIFGNKYAYKNCYGGQEQLMDELNKIPENHTFLFIKETARCAVTFESKERVGVLYERIPKIVKNAVIIQGLAGRACGYDVDDGMIVYSNIQSIVKYVAMVESNFTERDGFEMKRKTKKTHLNNSSWKNTQGEVKAECEVSEDSRKDVTIETFKTVEEARIYIKNTDFPHKAVGARGPSVKSWEKKKDENGFYMSTVGKGENRTKVRSTDEIKAIRKWNLDDTHAFTFYPCYKDIKDKSTLQWWVIHL